LSNFKSGTTRVLVATDIAARGIDVDNLTHVINYELPNVPETYVHRIGRTGRAGASGIAFSFCDHEEREFLRDIQKLIGNSIPVVNDHPHAMEISSMDIRRSLPQKPQGQQGKRSFGSSERAPQRTGFSERSGQRSFSNERDPQRTGSSKIVLRKAN
jgi:ATP-dependent RNA helicase RhlE